MLEIHCRNAPDVPGKYAVIGAMHLVQWRGWLIAVSLSNVTLFSNNDVNLQSERGGGVKTARKLRSYIVYGPLGDIPKKLS